MAPPAAASDFPARSSGAAFVQKAEGAVCGVLLNSVGVNVGLGDDLIREPTLKYLKRR